VKEPLLRFDCFQLDVATGELRKSGSLVKLPPQPAKILILLARNAGRLVTREDIRNEVWKADTFVDFEQGLNHCIKLIRAALGDDARAPRFIETLQRRGYRFLAQIDRAPDPIASSEKVVLAVVPFENLSGDPEQEYFSDGLTDEMITQLARLNPARLGVIGRTSAMKYKKSGRTITEIGRELGAAYVLEGSVRRAAGRVRITSRLVEVANQTHVWTQTYDRDFDDILTLQSEIAQAIAREIDIQLAPGEAARLAHPRGISAEAHEAYLKGRYFWNKRTADAFKKGIEYFTRAIEHEPNYAAAYDGLCDSYVMLACRGVLPVTETFTKAKGAAQHALTIDPELGEARASLAHVRLHSWEWEGLDAEFRRALELNPAYAMAHYWYSEYLMAIGRPEDAVSMVRTALSLDPLSSVLHASVGMMLYLARRVSESMEALQKGLEIDPGHFLLRFRLGLVTCRPGRHAKRSRRCASGGSVGPQHRNACWPGASVRRRRDEQRDGRCPRGGRWPDRPVHLAVQRGQGLRRSPRSPTHVRVARARVRRTQSRSDRTAHRAGLRFRARRFEVCRSPAARRLALVGDDIALIPLFYGGAMERHPCLIHRQDILGARDRIGDSSSGKEVTDRQSAAERWWRQFLEDTFLAKRTTERPTCARRLSSDDPMHVEKMNGDGLNRLRGFVAVMLHSVGIPEHCVE
jgi:TolB-like protein